MSRAALKVLVVDDEPLARERLQAILATVPKVDVVGECSGVRDAMAAIVAAEPDLVLLDIEMGDGTGFEMLEQLAVDRMPLVVFVTAYSSYATRAFDASAVDYVLKPVDPDRLRQAIERTRERLRTPERIARREEIRSLVRALAEARRTERIAVRDDRRTYLIPPTEIVWVEAKRNHCLVHLRDRTLTVRETLTSLDGRLPVAVFARVHRSAIVNVDRIRYVEPWFRGEYVVVLDDGARLTTSRTHGRSLHRFLNDAAK